MYTEISKRKDENMYTTTFQLLSFEDEGEKNTASPFKTQKEFFISKFI